MNELDLIKLTELGATAIVAIAGYITISKIIGKRNGNGVNKIQDILREQNENHLQHITDMIGETCNRITDGNERVVKSITDMHTDLASRLGEIKGVLIKGNDRIR
jgi:16S rRNA U1498 N3-methylase RsmE